MTVMLTNNRLALSLSADRQQPGETRCKIELEDGGVCVCIRRVEERRINIMAAAEVVLLII